MQQFNDLVDQKKPYENLPLLIRVDGEFEMVHFRSVPGQKKPYKPLVEVAKVQPEFKHQNIKGSLIGYRFPKYFAAMNLPGYHIHFVDDKRTCGGHVLGFKLISGKVSIAESSDFHLHLPSHSESFRKCDFEVDRSKETHFIEGGSQ
ncbi:Alpha-acetolactate decarboxylase family protein [Trichomonas vaginalis G3]|uniref:Alpha-acetolactate decarboxylase n=1 Tax=Trichomonas vaginalis (strain ATCC PRA-98 / G3) TaxID=412133 RepID=A2G2W3_TRIV3|nr:alpha-acetolactate decarboxylase family [Trichomonas vaginalis G3]EAX88505.1 Alpha-acetolactate decarboxylase family protein [Trichomonas vaginalis G3]KAI5497824.1 alpha-acetolactate decarboxylase family [Trichomonas vaginalis G3]|eukprot:XP_001301435.1 Alpha-acetolactate decarboxylase family protein [Trichomonas vaginalis G3]